MGRIFEVRKHTMFARWNRMAKQFSRIGKDITIAVKKGGSDPNANPALRRAIQNSRAVNMPKDKVDSAIKRASGRDAANFEEVIYEGYAPHGVAVLVECATDNPTRTVAASGPISQVAKASPMRTRIPSVTACPERLVPAARKVR